MPRTYHCATTERSRSRQLNEIVLVVALLTAVAFAYGARLARQPIVGEESRYGTGAREMLATGDWVVARQQGQIFAERPPMTMWLIALAGQLRGEVDAIAIRLPSVIAIVLTSLLIYVYARLQISQAVGFAAAIVYATFGHVLQIGRLGESESVFALFVSASLLIWHLGYSRNWRPLLVWSTGGACVALAALTKGPQAPVYFAAISGAYLLLRRDWRYLFSWQTASGVAVFLAIVAAWQIPYYQATNWNAVVATWTGLAADRFSLRGAASHLVTYPLETLVCLLPWSPIFISIFHPKTRGLLASNKDVVTFLVTATAVAYPTVWIAAGARGRYFMPLYPLVAILTGLILERCANAELGTYPRRAWNHFLLLWATVISSAAVIMVGSAISPDFAQRLYQSAGFGLAFALVALASAGTIWLSLRKPFNVAPLTAAIAIATFSVVGIAGAMINVNSARWSDPTNGIIEIRQALPSGAKLVSLGPVDHRFVYFYKDDIPEMNWPLSIKDLSSDVEYFCFMRYPKTPQEYRVSGRGRNWTTTPTTLPFEWEEVAAICTERKTQSGEQFVVIGRVVWPIVAKATDVMKPRPMIARQPTSTLRR